MIYIRIKCTSP